MQVFVANLQVLMAVLVHITIELTIAYTVNGSGTYKQIQDDYFLMVDRVEWWPWANTIRRHGGFTVMGMAFMT